MCYFRINLHNYTSVSVGHLERSLVRGEMTAMGPIRGWEWHSPTRVLLLRGPIGLLNPSRGVSPEVIRSVSHARCIVKLSRTEHSPLGTGAVHLLPRFRVDPPTDSIRSIRADVGRRPIDDWRLEENRSLPGGDKYE